jgi:predicted transcriptional regulator of viral defense system
MDDKDAPDRRQLVELASGQAGYFTAEQARSCGYSKALLSYHARQGTFVRVRHGLYRLAEYPSSRNEEVVAAWLAAGGEGAVVSHESAIDLLDLADVIPASIHITIPRSERWRKAPNGVTFHTIDSSLPRNQIQVREGIPITSAARSIVDGATTGIAHEQIRAAISSALERGLTTKAELLAVAKDQGGQAERLVKHGVESPSK